MNLSHVKDRLYPHLREEEIDTERLHMSCPAVRFPPKDI